jgi:hypothetical protein
MVAELNARTIRVTPGLRLIDVLEEAAVSPVLLESGGTIYRLSKDSEGTEPEREARSDELLPVQMREEQLAIIERMVRRRDEFFQGRALPDDSTDILRRERDERSRHVAGL